MSAVDACAESLQAAILRGTHPAGERLPPERELAATFGVGRATVRSALGRLATRGLLEVRQGSGYAVRDFRRAGGMELLPQLAKLSDQRGELAIARELLRVRRHLAAAVVERLGELETFDLDRAHAAVDTFERLAEAGADPAALAEADLEIVAALLEASGSVPLQLCFNPLMQVVRVMPRLRAAIYAAPETNVTAYRALLAAIASGEAPADPLALLAARDTANLAALAAATTSDSR
jgi:GntR family transcriptional repressor for pyruvate dehydrogenase complex